MLFWNALSCAGEYCVTTVVHGIDLCPMLAVSLMFSTVIPCLKRTSHLHRTRFSAIAHDTVLSPQTRWHCKTRASVCQCWCGRSSSDINKHGSSTKCNSNCAGGGRIQKCGGKYAVSVYQYEGTPRRIPGGTTYLGCYADDPADRALTLKKTSDGAEMTYEVRVVMLFNHYTVRY